MASQWVPNRLTPEQCEERRREAARLFPRVHRGVLSQAAMARGLGVSREAVRQWYTAWQAGGGPALRQRPKSGRRPRLSTRDWERLGRLLRRGAIAAGFDTGQWTLRRIAHVIRREFGVCYRERPLKAHGFTVQRPATQAEERDEALVQHD